MNKGLLEACFPLNHLDLRDFNVAANTGISCPEYSPGYLRVLKSEHEAIDQFKCVEREGKQKVCF